MLERRSELGAARTVVVKVGTAVVTRPDGRIALGRMGRLVEALAGLLAEGRRPVLVSSGAVGLGAGALGFSEVPGARVDRQACAAVGQGALMALYDGMFRRLGHGAAQVLLTGDDFRARRRFVNLTSTLGRLLELGVVPVVNENDSVSTRELDLAPVFADNDRLAALVAAALGADLLVILTNVDGIHTSPPGEPGARRIATWSPELDVRTAGRSPWGRGGMAAKLEACLHATRGGVAVVVADGRQPERLADILAGADLGTFFPARPTYSGRRRWLALATTPHGRLLVNAGARAALLERKASLLPAGIERVEGDFSAGEVVAIVGPGGRELARGITALSAREVNAARGRSGRRRAVVRRERMVILEEATT